MKAGKTIIIFLISGIIFFNACDSAKPKSTPAAASSTEDGSPAPQNSSDSISDGIRKYSGEVFSLQYPVNAKLKINTPAPPAKSELLIIGPHISIKPGNADWIYSGPGYELTVRTFANPEGLDAESWVRNSLLTTWREVRNEAGGIPVNEKGEIYEDMVGEAVIAGKPAFRANWFGGDSNILFFYIAAGQQVVEISFRDTPSVNQPLHDIQQDIYKLILSTFQFEGEH